MQFYPDPMMASSVGAMPQMMPMMPQMMAMPQMMPVMAIPQMMPMMPMPQMMPMMAMPQMVPMSNMTTMAPGIPTAAGTTVADVSARQAVQRQEYELKRQEYELKRQDYQLKDYQYQGGLLQQQCLGQNYRVMPDVGRPIM